MTGAAPVWSGSLMGKFLAYLDAQPRRRMAVASGVLLAAIAYLDDATPPELTLAVFHVVPVFLGAWYVGPWFARLLGTGAAVSWILSDELHPPAPAGPLLAWSFATRLLFFLVIATLVTLLRRAWDDARLQASTDPLTGLLNRRAFFRAAEAALARARRDGSSLALAYIDLDDFKLVNDRLGHAAGDELLVAVASTIRTHVRAGDVVARLGGDEFAVLLVGASAEVARAVGEHLSAALGTALSIADPSRGASIGLASRTGSDDATIDDLLHRADTSMYSVKAERKVEGPAAGAENAATASLPRRRASEKSGGEPRSLKVE